MRNHTLAFALFSSLAVPLTAADVRPDPKAVSIITATDGYRNPLESFSIDVELISNDGKHSETSKFRVHGRGADRSVVEFVAPASEKGKYLLMLRDAMWIYLPSTSRPIRISPLQRLMGQASNGDVARASFSVDYIPVSAVEEGDAWVVELVARDPSTSYGRIVLWVDRKSSEPRRADFHVASGKLTKRAHYRRFGELASRRMATVIEIEDLLRKGHTTVMKYSNLVSRQHPESMFTRDALARW